MTRPLREESAGIGEISRVGRLDVISGVPVSAFRSSLRAMGMQPEAFVFDLRDGVASRSGKPENVIAQALE